jgi:hypothetical protein
MEGYEDQPRLRCQVSDIVRVAASVHPELIGAFALIQGLRTDGRWDVYLDREIQEVAAPSGQLVTTRELSFRDESLEPIGNADEIGRRILNRPADDRHRPESAAAVASTEAP